MDSETDACVRDAVLALGFDLPPAELKRISENLRRLRTMHAKIQDWSPPATGAANS